MSYLTHETEKRNPGDASRREALHALKSGDYELAQALSAAATALQLEQTRGARA